MKKYIALIAIATSVLGFTACQKEYNSAPDAPEEVNTSRGTFTCKINGDPFVGEFKSTYRKDADGVNFLNINAVQYFETRRAEDYRSIGMTINWYDGAKEYNVPSDVSVAFVQAFTDEETRSYTIGVNDENNSFILTEFGENTKGTFSFTAVKITDTKDTVRITDGVFDFPNG